MISSVKLLNDDINKLRLFWLSLYCWHALNKREFPWRKTNNAYIILIAEILLQQTNARKVEHVYIEIIKRYPTPWAMLNADSSDLEEIIEPIGPLYRAERLMKIAYKLCTNYNGFVPQVREYLLELPGVGSYIADAVLCYAYNRSVVPIDTNVIRLFTRYFGLTYSKARARDDKLIAVKINSLFVFYNTKSANLAVLDFASAVCKAKSFNCRGCILKQKCKSHSD